MKLLSSNHFFARPSALLLLFAAVLPLPAASGRVVPLPTLVEAADAVIVGTIEAAAPLNAAINLNIRVLRVLKGEAPQGTALPVTVPHSVEAVPWAERAIAKLNGVTGLWFLRQGQAGEWQVLSRVIGLGDVPISVLVLETPEAPPPPPFDLGSQASPFDKTLAELAAATAQSPEKARFSAMRLTNGIDGSASENVRNIYDALSRNSAPAVRAIGLDGLIRMNDVGALSRLARDHEVIEQGQNIAWLSSAVCRVQADAAAESLSDLATHPDFPEGLRYCAAYAMRRDHSAAMLPHLARLLDADTPEIRYEAVIGLASFANQIPLSLGSQAPILLTTSAKGPYTTYETKANHPTRQVFDKDEQRYLDYWRIWWQAQGPDILTSRNGRITEPRP